LVEDGETHRDVVPVENMLGLWAYVELEVTDGVTAVGEERDLLVQLHPLRLQDLKQAPFRFGVQRLHKAKALARRDLGIVKLTVKAAQQGG
jgi:hypothetical protein